MPDELTEGVDLWKEEALSGADVLLEPPSPEMIHDIATTMAEFLKRNESQK